MPCTVLDRFFSSKSFKEGVVIPEVCIFVVAVGFLFVCFGEKLGRRQQDSGGRRMKGLREFT